jgi:hypothetical protein
MKHLFKQIVENRKKTKMDKKINNNFKIHNKNNLMIVINLIYT